MPLREIIIVLAPCRRTGISLVILFALACAVQAAPPLAILTGEVDPASVTHGVSFYHDHTGALTLEQVRDPAMQARFERCSRHVMHLGLTDDPVWVVFRVRNETEVEDWVLEVANSRLESAELCVVDGQGELDCRAMGTHFPNENRAYVFPAPAFPLTVPPGEERLVYLRVGHSGSMRFLLRLWQADTFARRVDRWTLVTLPLQGALFGFAVFGFCVLLGLRERSYVYLSLMTLAFAFFSLTQTGSGHLWVWPGANWWTDRGGTTLGLVTGVFFLLFTRASLELKRHAPVLDRVMQGLAVLAALAAGFALTDLTFKYYVTHSIAAVWPVVALCAGIQAWRHGYRPAKVFLLAWSLALGGTVFLVGAAVGVMQAQGIPDCLPDIAFLLAIVLWSFALTGRVRAREKETRQILEDEVATRTAELRQALVDVKTLHGLLPICSGCKKIRDDTGYWNDLENYVRDHTEADFSHGLCPDCMKELYPRYVEHPDGGGSRD